VKFLVKDDLASDSVACGGELTQETVLTSLTLLVFLQFLLSLMLTMHLKK